MKTLSALLTLVTALSAHAQSGAGGFTPVATPVTGAALQAIVEGKVFAVSLPNGVSWRMEFKSGGAYSFKSSRGLADDGKWSVQDGKLCTETPKIPAGCNEVRRLGDGLLLKRDNGEIVTMSVQ